MPAESSGGGVLERRIPKTGESVPAIGLGTWQVFDVAGDAAEMAQARDTLKAFVGLGARVVDSSPMYGSSESVTGQLASELGVRAKLFVATKVWTSGKQAGIRQMEDSMRKLRVERLDLMQVHNLVDADTHLATLSDWKASGRIRYAGVTHYHAGAHADLERFVSGGDIDFVQVNYSLAEPEAERRLLRAAADTRTAVIVNRPFAEGAMFRRVKGSPCPSGRRRSAARAGRSSSSSGSSGSRPSPASFRPRAIRRTSSTTSTPPPAPRQTRRCARGCRATSTRCSPPPLRQGPGPQSACRRPREQTGSSREPSARPKRRAIVTWPGGPWSCSPSTTSRPAARPSSEPCAGGSGPPGRFASGSP